jgi:hypothetical protein
MAPGSDTEFQHGDRGGGYYLCGNTLGRTDFCPLYVSVRTAFEVSEHVRCVPLLKRWSSREILISPSSSLGYRPAAFDFLVQCSTTCPNAPRLRRFAHDVSDDSDLVLYI